MMDLARQRSLAWGRFCGQGRQPPERMGAATNSDTNGCAGFRSMLRRGHQGTFHHMGAIHLHRYFNDVAGQPDIRESDTVDRMVDAVAAMTGKRLMRRDPVS